jgi:hypothetical protein
MDELSFKNDRETDARDVVELIRDFAEKKACSWSQGLRPEASV